MTDRTRRMLTGLVAAGLCLGVAAIVGLWPAANRPARPLLVAPVTALDPLWQVTLWGR